MAQVPVRFRIESAPSAKTVPVRFTVEAAQTGAPATPQNLGGTAKPNQVTWFWSAVTDADLLGYELQTRPAGGAWTLIYSGDVTSFIETGLQNDVDRQARVRAVDTLGNVSLWSTPISRTPTAIVDATGGTPPPPPVTTTLSPSADLHKIFVSAGGATGGGTTSPGGGGQTPGEVVVQPGTITGQQYGVPYALIGPDGTRVVFNDHSDPDNIGMLSEITGLDSPEVRESADDLVELDGGVHGSFFYGRRPITMSGMIHTRDTEQRNYAMTRLQRVANAMRKDATLMWTPDGGIPQNVLVRKQAPLRISGGWQKSFQLALVAADPRIYSVVYSQALTSSSPWGVQPQNRGSFESPPVITLYGPVLNPRIQNFTTGEIIKLNVDIPAGEYMVIDTRHRTVIQNNAVSRYATVDFLSTDWWQLQPGLNDVRLSFQTIGQGASMVLQWRDAWI